MNNLRSYIILILSGLFLVLVATGLGLYDVLAALATGLGVLGLAISLAAGLGLLWSIWKGSGRSNALVLAQSAPASFVYSQERENDLNRMTKALAYPANHFYSITKGSLIAGTKLTRRFELIQRLYPERLDSLLDIGCAKGFFVFQAGLQAHKPRAVGLDVTADYISFCRGFKDYLALPNVAFHQYRLHEIVGNLHELGGPFQTVLMINTYHYLFYGSPRDRFGYLTHRRIFQELWTICSERLIFSSPLELSDCPGNIRKASLKSDKMGYSRKHVLSAAEEFFTVRQDGYLGSRPLFVMHPRPKERTGTVRS